MLVETDLTKNNCNFRNCRHFRSGKCMNPTARKDCLEIAFAVLCITDKLKRRGACDFCVDAELGLMMAEDKCERYNRKDTMGKANPHLGVKFCATITDNHLRVYEKDSRVYKLKFCPVCGRKFRRLSDGGKRGL